MTIPDEPNLVRLEAHLESVLESGDGRTWVTLTTRPSAATARLAKRVGADVHLGILVLDEATPPRRKRGG